MGSRAPSRSASRTACSVLAAAAVAFAAGCGGRAGGDHLAPWVGFRLARLADAVAGGACAGRLQAALIRAINRGDVPPGLQEELLSDVNELAELAPCGAPREPGATARARAVAAAVRAAGS